jgi:hypothetical protein
MRLTRLTVALTLIVAATAAGSVAASAKPSGHKGKCARIAGEFTFASFQFTSATAAVGTGVVRGDVNGTFHAQYWDIHTGADGVIDTLGSHVLTTPHGSLVTLDAIRLIPDSDPSSGFVRPDSRLRVVGGTGSYEGATGLLRTSGRVNLSTLEGSIGYEGNLCSRGDD